jgi:hypothetical protein
MALALFAASREILALPLALFAASREHPSTAFALFAASREIRLVGVRGVTHAGSGRWSWRDRESSGGMRTIPPRYRDSAAPVVESRRVRAAGAGGSRGRF